MKKLPTNTKGKVKCNGTHHAEGGAEEGENKLGYYLLAIGVGFFTGLLMGGFFILLKQFM